MIIYQSINTSFNSLAYKLHLHNSNVNSITEIHRSFPFSPISAYRILMGKDMHNKIYAKSKKGVKTNFSGSENLKVKVSISNCQ